MYTKCPNCQTVFAVTEAQVGAHHGLVRCGKCRDIFNASWNLVDMAPNGTNAAPEPQTPATVETPPPVAPTPDDARMEIDEEEVVTSPVTIDDAPDEFPPPEPPEDELPDGNDEEFETGEQLTLQVDTTMVRYLDPGQGTVDRHFDRNRESVELELPDAFTDYAEVDDDAMPAAPGPEAGEFDLAFEEDDSADATTETPLPPRAGPPPLEATTTPADDADEEIVIEAPPSLRGWFEEEEKQKTAPAAQPDDIDDLVPPPAPLPQSTQLRRAALKSQEPRRPPIRIAASDSTTQNTRDIRQLGDDVRLVEIQHPQPVKTVAWALGTAILVLLVVWQLKLFYFGDMAQSSTLRPVLESVCGVVGCSVPARSAAGKIELTSTRVAQHPDTPGAMRLTVSLINHAEFPQPLPPLELTLSEKTGQVVGQRIYRPAEYYGKKPALMKPGEIETVFIDLAHPTTDAVGYEVQLVRR